MEQRQTDGGQIKDKKNSVNEASLLAYEYVRVVWIQMTQAFPTVVKTFT